MTRPSHPIERAVGIDHYVSETDGTGGRLRARDRDFHVTEREGFDVEPIDADPTAYSHLVLRATLVGWETNAFASRLSDALGISRERVSWAGTKDKRAVTTQLFSVRDVEPVDLPSISDADIEVVGRAGRSIRFGDLVGNEFEIVVREADRPENVAAITDELRAFGDGTVAVPNYFGQQRFGSRRPVTHEVGLHVVRGDWEGAVLAYVGNPHGTEPPDTREARRFVEETRDWEGALERLPSRLGFERAMCHRLAERGDGSPADYREALRAVPTNLQRLFVNAAQSYAFNRMLGERIERGLPFARAVAGDVVCFADVDEREGLAIPDVSRSQRVSADRVDAINRHVKRGRAFVTAPLVGTETTLADGEPGAIERAVLSDLDLEPAAFDLPSPFGSSGTRRAILVGTDLGVEREPLTFDFSLPSGSYATVLLREYLKAEPAAMA